MLSHHESHVLALVRKWQPTTAYFVRKTLQRSLASTFSDSPGSVYPVIERLKRNGFILAARSEEDRRGTEQLSCSEAGDAAVADWLLREDAVDLLPEDPWRTRMIFAESLDRAERQRWLARLHANARAMLLDIDDRAELSVDAAYADALENARLLTEARIVWLERLLARSVTDSRED